jgi:hypothetical protein
MRIVDLEGFEGMRIQESNLGHDPPLEASDASLFIDMNP